MSPELPGIAELPELEFYDRIRSKHHPQIGARKAIVAVARKLTLIIYRVLKEQREYITNI